MSTYTMVAYGYVCEWCDAADEVSRGDVYSFLRHGRVLDRHDADRVVRKVHRWFHRRGVGWLCPNHRKGMP